MALKRPSALLHWPPPLHTPPPTTTTRALHRLHAPTLRTPRPTPFVPDVPTFLTLIGRNLASHASKIPSWEALFTLSSLQLREAGVEPARARRYLLWWRERFRNGITGIGGELGEVRDGVAELRIVEVESRRKGDRQAMLGKGAGMRRVVVNVPATVALPVDLSKAAVEEGGKGEVGRVEVEGAQIVSGVRILAANAIAGTGVEAVKGHQGVARLRVQSGLWEERRGHKVDGGERRKEEVRYKRRAQERKMAR
ncbi:telomere length regulation protein [Friedmanniomyces endolithicus]|nr:telomere length regulation protein [Friedmanniomyces endolithicus]